MNDAHRQALIDGERVGEGWTLVPPRTMQSRTGGVRHGRSAGGSLEFRDYRDYQPGDDLRYLDWRVFARSDKLIVKQFHEEVSPHVELIIDGSRSMALADSRKPHIALSLAAMFASAARNSSFPSAMWIAADRVAAPPDSKSAPSEWTTIAFDYPADPAAALLAAAPLLRPMSVRFLISDLLWRADPTQIVQALAARASALVIVEVLAAADENPPISGDYRLIDSETDEIHDIIFDVRAAAEYRDALLRHRSLWDEAARAAGAVILRCVADEVGTDLMFEDLAAADILRPSWSRS